MTAMIHIKRFTVAERLFHLCLMLTFLTQAGTGCSRLFLTTDFGRQLTALFGGYESAYQIHQVTGILMIAGFLVHICYLLLRVRGKNLVQSVIGPDSLVPNLQDARHLWRKILWTLGIGSLPKLDRWAYWEKFDYWAVFWGMPLLAGTGLMLMYPLLTSRFLPGWALNIAAFLHRAEAVLAVSYIFIVHFFIGHLRPASFPMSETMFSGTITLEEAEEEKPEWVERLKREGKLELMKAKPPSSWYRTVYYIFGCGALSFGVYLLVNGAIYSRYARLH
jgi:cytochrome b subunit of formate dehydrogenase